MYKRPITLLLALLMIAGLFAFVNKPAPKKGIEHFSISLSVKDIEASYAFYQKLGFTQVKDAGGIEQKWMVLENGAARIGLFHGMFPKNTITLNPSDARSIHKSVTAQGMETMIVSGMDKTEGPASFAMIDPDGNPVLFDQHQ